MQVKKSIRDTIHSSAGRPSCPPATTGDRVLELSIIDQVMLRLYTSILFFFPDKPNQDAPELLKLSLAQTLSLFYPLAGRYRERINGELEVVCNDEGAEFVETWVDCALDSFLPKVDPHPDFALLVPQIDPFTDISQVPLLLAQITHFECGRVCLGVRLHHHVCDGPSIAQFLSCWAMVTFKVKEGVSDVNELLITYCNRSKPHLDRSLLRANDPPHPSAEHPEYQTQVHVYPTTMPPCCSKVFHFTPSRIEELRAKASGAAHLGSTAPPMHSRFEALAAHLWQGFAHARALPRDQTIRFGFAVDGRKRFSPPLPEDFFGNAIFFGYAECTAGDLSEKPLSFAAERVKAAIAKVDDAHMRSAIDWIAQQESPRVVMPSSLRPFTDLAFTSWWRFPFCDLDFGWGKPSHLRIPEFAFDGFIIMLPSPLGAQHVDAYVGLCTDHMLRFEQFLSQAA